MQPEVFSNRKRGNEYPLFWLRDKNTEIQISVLKKNCCSTLGIKKSCPQIYPYQGTAGFFKNFS